MFSSSYEQKRTVVYSPEEKRSKQTKLGEFDVFL